MQKMGFQKHIFEQEDLTLSYSIGGEGETLLLIHGFGGEGDVTFIRQLPYFAKSYQVIVPDLLWFGESNSSKTPSLNAQAEAIIQLLDSLNIDKVHIVGLSYGGFVCFELYRTIKERIQSVVIVDSPGPSFNLNYLDEFLDKNGVKAASDLFVPKNAEELQRLMDIVMYRDIKLPASILQNLFDKYWSRFQKEQTILLEELPENKVTFNEFTDYDQDDFLVIWGKNDEVFPYQSGLDLAKFLNCDIIAFNRSGHIVSVDKARKFNHALSQFLNRELKNN
jgi:pimeloyl-ACP methyl ester carboxylesterase